MLMAEIHNCLIVTKPGENLHVLTQRIDGYAIVPRPDYDALAARLAEVERVEQAARAVALATIASGDHTTWFKPLAGLLEALKLPANSAPGEKL